MNDTADQQSTIDNIAEAARREDAELATALAELARRDDDGLLDDHQRIVLGHAEGRTLAVAEAYNLGYRHAVRDARDRRDFEDGR